LEDWKKKTERESTIPRAMLFEGSYNAFTKHFRFLFIPQIISEVLVSEDGMCNIFSQSLFLFSIYQILEDDS
jgi:hypothetical protein